MLTAILCLSSVAMAQQAVQSTSVQSTQEIESLLGNVKNILLNLENDKNEQQPEQILGQGRFGDDAELLLKVKLDNKVQLDGSLWVKKADGVWLASLADTVTLLDFPILIYDFHKKN